MNWAEFPEVVRSRFKTLVADPLGLRFVIDNETPSPDFGPKEEHFRIYIRTGESDQKSFGEVRRVRTVGVVMILIRVPWSVADKRAKELGVFIRDNAFNGVFVNEVTFGFPSLKEMGRQRDWWQVNVSVPFEYDEML